MHVFVKYTVDNLDANGVHMFAVEDGLQTEFVIFDDSQKFDSGIRRLEDVGSRKRQSIVFEKNNSNGKLLFSMS